MASKNITMTVKENGEYVELHPETTVEQVSGVLPIEKGGTNAETVEQARLNLGLGSVATENFVPIDKGGTGSSVAYDGIVVSDVDYSPWNINYWKARYYPYLNLVYFDITGTIINERRLQKGASFDMCKILDSRYCPSGRRALSVAMVGSDNASAYIDSNGVVHMSVKSEIVENRMISISGFYRI